MFGLKFKSARSGTQVLSGKHDKPVLCIGTGSEGSIFLGKAMVSDNIAITGPDGSGKTEILLSSAYQTMMAGGTVIYVDADGSRRTLGILQEMATSLGRIDDLAVLDLAGLDGAVDPDFPTHFLDPSGRAFSMKAFLLALLPRHEWRARIQVLIDLALSTSIGHSRGEGAVLTLSSVLASLSLDQLQAAADAAVLPGATSRELKESLSWVQSDPAYHALVIDHASDAFRRSESVIGHLSPSKDLDRIAGMRCFQSRLVYVRLPSFDLEPERFLDAITFCRCLIGPVFNSVFLDTAPATDWAEVDRPYKSIDGIPGMVAFDGIDAGVFDECENWLSASMIRAIGYVSLVAFRGDDHPQNVVDFAATELATEPGAAGYFTMVRKGYSATWGRTFSQMPGRGRGLLVSSLFPPRLHQLRRGLGQIAGA